MSGSSEIQFGELLRVAREAKQLSIVQVSETLKLPLDKIQAIEDSNIQNLPPAAYTNGYLKLFSKLVEIDEIEVLQAYNRAAGVSDAPSLLSATSDIPAQASSQHPGMRLVSYGLIIIAFILIIVWWQDRSPKEDKQAQPVEQVSEQQTSIENGLAENSLFEGTADIKTLDSGADQLAEPELVLSENSLAPEAASSEQADTTIDEPVSEIVTEIQQGTIEENTYQSDESETKDESDKILAMAKQASAVAPVGEDLVSLLAIDDCWIEISDANGHLLFFSLLKKGEEVELKGQEPFKVFLGRAKVVELKINDMNYDVTRFIRSNQVARFTMSMHSALEMQDQ